MANGELEIELFGKVLDYPMSAVAYEPNEPPTRIFDIHDDVIVAVDWTLPKPLNRMICGTFDVDLFLESQGRGREFSLDAPTVALDPHKTSYHAEITIPHDTIHPEPDETDIPYKLTVTVTYKDQLGHPGPIAGFVELPLVQFYLDA